ARIEASARAVATRAGLRPDLSVWLDVTEDTPYSEPTGENAAGQWVMLRHRPPQRLGDVSFLLGELRNKRIQSARLVFLPELREDIERAISAEA
ncbi:MAG: hypothetical protein KC492_07115, partial [Myxococcales bacterium]|nr:hypothetical protein [Myxococcales bacterium]